MSVAKELSLIVNGKAAGNPDLRLAVEQCRSEGAEISVHVTWEAGDAARFAQELGEQKVSRLIAVGGDGTVSEVVQGLMELKDASATSVGVVPFGTANDFANGCGIPIGDPMAALQLALSATPVAIDIACCNDRCFLNVASGGFGAEVTTNTPDGLKKALGGAAYSIVGLISAIAASPDHARIVDPDGAIQQDNLLVVAVGNGRLAGGGFQVAPNAFLNDGMLDVLGIEDVDVTRLGQIFSEMKEMNAETNEFVHSVQLPAVRIESNSLMQMNLDGEPIRAESFEFRIIPKALKFLLPKDAPIQR
ncbi:lipid kinase YegS [Thalassoglobus sp. JC818]|uniref:lipid kinase YegS n=1 Tax=Thalassoglobus sp. JC818 TaxID=3232136 RepID=UPI00345B314A